jgi:aryl-alcohol dehydrogenase-like predicted oxidoreductase
MSDQVLTKVQSLKPIASELGLEMGQLAIAWVLQNSNVAAAIVGASRPKQITENAKAAGVKLPVEVMKKIDDILGDSMIRDPELTLSPATRP